MDTDPNTLFVRGVSFDVGDEQFKEYFRWVSVLKYAIFTSPASFPMHACLWGAMSPSHRLPLSSTICSGIGPVKQAFIVKGSGKTHKGFGFVQFALHEDAERAAKQANGVELGGRKMQVRVWVVSV